MANDDASVIPENLTYLRDELIPLLQPYVTRITLFGSVARGEDRTDSDIDILVMLKPPGERPTLGLRWFALEQELSQQLERPVELVSEDALSSRVRPYINQDRVVLYEA